MSDRKTTLCALILTLLSSSSRLISAQEQVSETCRVPMVCSGSQGREAQWRDIDMNRHKGDRGPPGKRGPPCLPGTTTSASINRKIQQMAGRLDRMERNLIENFEAQLLNAERRANASAEHFNDQQHKDLLTNYKRIATAEQQLAVVSEQLENLRRAMNNLQDDIQWGSVAYEASNGFSYKITRTTQNFQESREACSRMGGHLAYIGIRNASIHSEIMQHLVGGWNIAFIDLTDTETEEVFRWRDGVLVSKGWTKWHRGEPNNWGGDEDCASISADDNHAWYDSLCHFNHYALCERRIA